jgi:two-component system, OmpR family, phosphate regulon sensor histidine kinase PhoR
MELDQAKRLRLIEMALASSGEGVVIVDEQGYLAFANEAAWRILNRPLSPDGPVPQESRQFQLGCPKTPGGLPDGMPLRVALQGHAVNDCRFALTNADGSVSGVSCSAYPIRSEDGTVAGAISVLRDVTEGMRAEREREQLLQTIEEERARFVAVVRQMPAGVIIAEAPSGRFIYANDKVGKLGHRFIGEVDGENDEITWQGYHSNGEPYGAGDWPLARSISTGEVITGEEINYRRGDGSWGVISSSSAPVFDSTGEIVAGVAVFSDITRQRRLEQLRDDFLATAAHELKTPVAVVKGYTQLLQRKVNWAAESKEAQILRMIDYQADRIDRLVQELLEASRLKTSWLDLRRESLNLTEVVSLAVISIAPTTEKHRLILSAAEPAMVEADRSAIERVLSHLLSNAIRYSPQGGDIEAAVTLKDARVVVSVKDGGIGIARRKQRRIFERFYRAHAGTAHDYSGLGIGLYVSREIIKEHGGEMWFESEEGKGSTFYFSLPLAVAVDNEPQPWTGVAMGATDDYQHLSESRDL